ncbi:MAG: pyruvate, water dikinase regulatory protein [Thermoanaerobaculales bacterium]
MSQVYVVSGGMGTSGEQVALTALAQFGEVDVPVAIVPRIRTVDELRGVVERAVASNGVIIHTLVDAGLREELVTAAREQHVVELDVTGPVLDVFAKMLGREPLGKPGLYRKIREDYFRRIDAIEFAVRHDDGRNCAELGDADIVLTGVSRAGKTPLAMYLAMRGYKTANVPLVKNIEPPAELFDIKRGRVVGLTLDPDRLVSYRRRRQRDLGASDSTAYSDPREIFQEIEYAREVFRKGRFSTIDITAKPIEESADEVVALVSRQVGT